MPRKRNKTDKVQAPAGTRIKLKWVRSAIRTPETQKRVIKGLGFTRLNQVIEREDTLSIRGMVAKVPHMVRSSENVAEVKASRRFRLQAAETPSRQDKSALENEQ